MDKSLKIVFMGTPQFSVGILQAIQASPHRIEAIVSVPDKAAGRGQKLHRSAVAQFATENEITLLQPEKLRDDTFVSALQKLEADVFVVVAFRMLPQVVWQIPPKGTFNLHASLLPQYRGAAPINWAIINGETETGISTFLIDEKIDTGNILLQQKIEINPDETAGELHDEMMVSGGKLVVETLDGLADESLMPMAQKADVELKNAPKIFKEDCRIKWNDSLENIYNHIRGLSPYPAAWTTILQNQKEKIFKIYKAKIQYNDQVKPKRKFIKENQKLGIVHKEGYLWLEEMQLQGKRRMKAIDFMNGFSWDSDTEII